MKHTLLSALTKSALGLALALLASSSFAQAKKEVTFAHQDMVFPYRTVMESGELEKTTGYKIKNSKTRCVTSKNCDGHND